MPDDPDKDKNNPSHAHAEAELNPKADHKNSEGDQPSLSSQEGDAASNPMNYGPSAGDDLRKKIGSNDSGDKRGQKFNKKPNLKKRATIALAAAGGSAAIAALIFFATLPLKVEHIVENIRNEFGAASNEALDKSSQHLMSRWITKNILPNLNKGTCHTTVDPGCVSLDKGASPISKLYNAWRQGKLEQKLATKYGIVLGRQGSSPNGYYLLADGQKFNFNGGDDIFKIGDATSRSKISRSLGQAYKEASFRDKIYYRFVMAPMLKAKYGVVRCTWEKSCKLQEFKDSASYKKTAAKAWLVQRVVSPFSASYSLIMQCVIIGADYCSANLSTAQPGDREKQSPVQKRLQSQMATFAAKYGTDKLADVAKLAEDASKNGFSRTVARQMATTLVRAFAGDVAAQAAGSAAEKAIPVIGWLFLASRLVTAASTVGPVIAYASYAANSTAAVNLYYLAATTADEIKSGNVDPEVLGSLTEAYSTNISGTAGDSSDATASPLYGAIMDQEASPVSTALNNVLPSSTAYAADNEADEGKYLCDDGKPLTQGVACPEENFARSNQITDTISGFVNDNPALWQLRTMGKVIDKVGQKFGAVFAKVFNAACDTVGKPIGCPAMRDFMGKIASNMFGWLINKLVPSPISNSMSGGRTFNMTVAGGDAALNSACRDYLGCTKISDLAVNKIRAKAKADRQAEFNERPIFAKLFDTHDPMSLVSRISIAIPFSWQSGVPKTIGNFLASPFTQIGKIISSTFSPLTAKADEGLTKDPFGIVQFGYPDSQIPEDPETFWTNNCIHGPYGISNPNDLNSLDISQWLNNNNNVMQDEQTGETIFKKANPCLLIQASVQTLGGFFDSSLLPSGNGSGQSTEEETGGNGWTWPIAKADYTGLSQCWNNPRKMEDGTIGHHAGMDIRAPTGTTAYAANAGEVVKVGYGEYTGNYIMIKISDSLYINYQHLKNNLSNSLPVGTHVNSGQPLGPTDNTGRSTGPHLHFGVAVQATTGSYGDNSLTRNPLNYLPKDRDTGLCHSS